MLASGFTLLQVAANPYVAVLGPRETASSRLTLTQAFNSVGTTIAPVVGSWLILPSTDLGVAASDAARMEGDALGAAPLRGVRRRPAWR